MEMSNRKYKNNILKYGSKNLNVENWAVFHPNGTHMFTCGEKKANWYLDRKLAKKIGNNKIKLTFEPKGSGYDSDEVFGKAERKPICVVTGIDNSLQRHHIVPYCYRSYFPEIYKSKNHHDVVLIHHKEHSDYEREATKYKDIIADMYGVKKINELNKIYTLKLRDFGRDNSIALNNIHMLFKSYHSISDDIRNEKLDNIANLIDISYSIISKWNYIQFYYFYCEFKKKHEFDVNEFKKNNRYLYDHGYHVVQKLKTEKDIDIFVKLWRKHFIDIMNPKYMPDGWSINFRVKTEL